MIMFATKWSETSTDMLYALHIDNNSWTDIYQTIKQPPFPVKQGKADDRKVLTAFFFSPAITTSV